VCLNLAVCHISAFDLYPQLTELVDMSSAGIRVDMVYKYVCVCVCVSVCPSVRKITHTRVAGCRSNRVGMGK